jgi:hypothetical protein
VHSLFVLHEDRSPSFNFKYRWTLSAFAFCPSRRSTTILHVDLEHIRSSSQSLPTSFTFKCRWTLSAFALRPSNVPERHDIHPSMASIRSCKFGMTTTAGITSSCVLAKKSKGSGGVRCYVNSRDSMTEPPLGIHCNTTLRNCGILFFLQQFTNRWGN